MKHKLTFALMVVLICGMPISLTGQNPNIPIKIRLAVDKGRPPEDQFMNNLVKGYFLQSLRQIPDIIVVDDNEMYTIHVLPSKVVQDSYTIMYIVMNPFKIDLSNWVYPEHRELVKGLLKGTGNIETYGFFNANRQTLEEQCKSTIVSFDAGIFQPLRKLRQQFFREIQSGNP